MDKLTVRRLTKLADYMDKLPPSANKHFAMGNWFFHKGEHNYGLQDGEEPKKEQYFTCGTSACALGWAASMPYFRRAGLRIVYQEYSDFGEQIGAGSLSYKGEEVYSDDTSNSGFLALSPEDANHLFGPDTPVKTTKAWAKRCRKFLAKQKLQSAVK